MIGLCNLIIDFSRVSADSALDPILPLYYEKKSFYFVERAIWLHCELLKERQLFREAGTLMVKLAGEVYLNECKNTGHRFKKFAFNRASGQLLPRFIPVFLAQICILSGSCGRSFY